MGTIYLEIKNKLRETGKMKEFNLSEKEIDYKQYPLSTSAFLREDVKEFIRLLKEESKTSYFVCDDCFKKFQEIIDKLAGDKLNGN